MRALILAAGRGSRMRHLTQDRPKALVPYRGTPLIARQCAALRSAGATEIGIATGYRADAFAPYADATFHNPRWADTQMIASLTCAAEWLHVGPVVVSYSDIFYTPDSVTALADAKTPVAITYDPDWLSQWAGRFADPLDDAETFRLQHPQTDPPRIAGIGQTPTDLSQIEGQFMGLIRFTPDGWAAAARLRAGLTQPEADAQSMTALLDALVRSGTPVGAIPVSGPWGEIDSVEDLAYFEGETGA